MNASGPDLPNPFPRSPFLQDENEPRIRLMHREPRVMDWIIETRKLLRRHGNLRSVVGHYVRLDGEVSPYSVVTKANIDHAPGQTRKETFAEQPWREHVEKGSTFALGCIDAVVGLADWFTVACLSVAFSIALAHCTRSPLWDSAPHRTDVSFVTTPSADTMRSKAFFFCRFTPAIRAPRQSRRKCCPFVAANALFGDLGRPVPAPRISLNCPPSTGTPRVW